MVIRVFLHSCCSSDRGSSSISSLTIVSSSSNISLMRGRFTDSSTPISAFEEDDNFKKECLRWKAHELQINKKMCATKEFVVFLIGMMLWEGLTLQVPYGEYEVKMKRKKIASRKRQKISETCLKLLEVVSSFEIVWLFYYIAKC